MPYTYITLRNPLIHRSVLTYPDGQQVPIEYETKPGLRAVRCSACGRAYQMDRWNSNDRNVGEWAATMDKSPVGNMLTLPVCSFACAHKLTEGRWRELAHPDIRAFVEVGASPARVACTMTYNVKYEEELIKEWEESPAKHPETIQVPLVPPYEDGA